MKKKDENAIPLSAVTVLTVLEEGQEMTHKQLTNRCNLSPRTIRHALKILRDRQQIIAKFNFRDARQIIYAMPRAGE